MKKIFVFIIWFLMISPIATVVYADSLLTGDELLYEVWGSSENDIFIVGSNYNIGDRGVIFHFDGHTWQEMDIDTDDLITGVWGSSIQMFT